MDLIYTDAQRADQGVLSSYSFDLSFGVDENDFEMTLDRNESTLEYGAFVYIEGTEFGGVVDGKKNRTDMDTITYTGRTWHGMINSKVIMPDSGADYLIVSGDANEIISMLIGRVGLGDLFTVDSTLSGITIARHKFRRYCMAYEAICDMLADYDAKLRITWRERSVILSAVPIVDYTAAPVDNDMATMSVERRDKKVNHLVCLGRGELAEREVLHLYADHNGDIGTVQYYTGLNEITAIYDYSAVESSAELHTSGVKKLQELRSTDTAEISVLENNELDYDIGDIVGAMDFRSGTSVSAPVSQKIVKISNGVVSIEYKTGTVTCEEKNMGSSTYLGFGTLGRMRLG